MIDVILLHSIIQSLLVPCTGHFPFFTVDFKDPNMSFLGVS
jgi:hypothetical protein